MADLFGRNPLAADLLGLPKPKPDCVCGHPHSMHKIGGICALSGGGNARQMVMSPGRCWCLGYEMNDVDRLQWEPSPLGKIEGDE